MIWLAAHLPLSFKCRCQAPAEGAKRNPFDLRRPRVFSSAPREALLGFVDIAAGGLYPVDEVRKGVEPFAEIRELDSRAAVVEMCQSIPRVFDLFDRN